MSSHQTWPGHSQRATSTAAAASAPAPWASRRAPSCACASRRAAATPWCAPLTRLEMRLVGGSSLTSRHTNPFSALPGAPPWPAWKCVRVPHIQAHLPSLSLSLDHFAGTARLDTPERPFIQPPQLPTCLRYTPWSLWPAWTTIHCLYSWPLSRLFSLPAAVFSLPYEHTRRPHEIRCFHPTHTPHIVPHPCPTSPLAPHPCTSLSRFYPLSSHPYTPPRPSPLTHTPLSVAFTHPHTPLRPSPTPLTPHPSPIPHSAGGVRVPSPRHGPVRPVRRPLRQPADQLQQLHPGERPLSDPRGAYLVPCPTPVEPI